MSKSKLKLDLDARLDEVDGVLAAAGIRTVRKAGPEAGTITGTIANGDTFTVSLNIGGGRVAGRVTHSPRQGRIADYAAADFQTGLRRIVTLHTGEPFSDQDRSDVAGTVPEVAALRLVLVETSGEGFDLVSLRHGVIIASGESFGVPHGVPCVVVGEEEEQEARRLAGVPRGEGWPGWAVILPWLDRRFPAGN